MAYLSTDPYAGVYGAAESSVGLPTGLLAAIAQQENVDPRHNNPLGLSTDSGVMSFDPAEAVDRIHRQAALLTNPNGPYRDFAATGDINDLAKVYSPVGAANDIYGTNATEAAGIKAALGKREYLSTDPAAATNVVSPDQSRMLQGMETAKNAVGLATLPLTQDWIQSQAQGPPVPPDIAAFQESEAGTEAARAAIARLGLGANWEQDRGLSPNAIALKEGRIQFPGTMPTDQLKSALDTGLGKLGEAADYTGVSNVIAQLRGPHPEEPFISPELIKQAAAESPAAWPEEKIIGLLPQKFQTAYAGIGNAATSTASSLTSRDNLLILGGLAFMPEAAGGAVAKRLLSLGFSAGAAGGMWESLKAARQEDDPKKFWEDVGNAASQGFIMTAAGLHGISSAAPKVAPGRVAPELPEAIGAAHPATRFGNERADAEAIQRAAIERQLRATPTGALGQKELDLAPPERSAPATEFARFQKFAPGYDPTSQPNLTREILARNKPLMAEAQRLRDQQGQVDYSGRVEIQKRIDEINRQIAAPLEVSDASSEPSTTGVPRPQVRGGVDETAPLPEQRQATTARQQAEEPVPPVPEQPQIELKQITPEDINLLPEDVKVPHQEHALAPDDTPIVIERMRPARQVGHELFQRKTALENILDCLG